MSPNTTNMLEVNEVDTKVETYQFEKYNSEFNSQIVELQKHLWSQDAGLNKSYLEWKYDNNPYVDDTLIYTAFFDDQMVGMVGMYGAKWQFGAPAQDFVGLCVGDIVIHPDHRNRGLFSKLMSFALNDLIKTNHTYVFDFSASREVALSLLMTGWHNIVFLQTAHWHRPQRSELNRLWTYARKFLGCSPDRQVRPFAALDRHHLMESSHSDLRVAIERAPRPGAMAELAERVRNDGRIRHLRDKQFFSWRFQNPLSEFRFLFFGDVPLGGYIVLHAPLRSHGNKVIVSVVDWEFTNVQVWADLLEAAICLGNFDKVTISCATLSDQAKAILKKIGFNFVEKSGGLTRDIHQPTILTRSVRKEMAPTEWALGNRRLVDLTNWDLRPIYSDNF